MNLGYPLAIDDGTLLEKFGDPERTGAKLPLWVLIDPSGTVVEYKLGNYDIKADTGLSELDKKITRLIRKERQKNAREISCRKRNPIIEILRQRTHDAVIADWFDRHRGEMRREGFLRTSRFAG